MPDTTSRAGLMGQRLWGLDLHGCTGDRTGYTPSHAGEESPANGHGSWTCLANPSYERIVLSIAVDFLCRYEVMSLVTGGRDGWRRLAKQGGWHIVSPSKLGQLFGIACLTSGSTAQSRKDHCWELSQVFGDCCAERHDAMS